eukprot:365502-Chlamydomonas_euryale.AAC.6
MGKGGSSAFEQAGVLTGHAKAVVSVKFRPGDGALLASGSADATAKIWRVGGDGGGDGGAAGGECAATLSGHEQGICDVAWNSGGSYMCTASDDHTLKLWVGTRKRWKGQGGGMERTHAYVGSGMRMRKHNP